MEPEVPMKPVPRLACRFVMGASSALQPLTPIKSRQYRTRLSAEPFLMIRNSAARPATPCGPRQAAVSPVRLPETFLIKRT